MKIKVWLVRMRRGANDWGVKVTPRRKGIVIIIAICGVLFIFFIGSQYRRRISNRWYIWGEAASCRQLATNPTLLLFYALTLVV